MTLPQRYARNISALTEAECTSLANKRVAVFGCGGLGGSVIEGLARIGVGHLRVVDGDVFEEHNLNRQILSTSDTLGVSKVEAAVQRVALVNDLVHVEPMQVMLDEQNSSELVAGVDCVVDCLDNLQARFWLGVACQRAGIPLVYGAIAGWFGQVCTVFPGDVSFVEIYGNTDGTSQHLKLGNLPFTAHSVAAIQASEAVKVLIGRGELIRNRLLMLDLLDGSAEELELG